MKKLSILTMACLATLAFTTLGNAQIELTINGGFETGDFTGWAQFPNAGGLQEISTINPSSGTFSAFLDPVTKPGDNLIKQANLGVGQVNPGDTVTIAFDYRGTTSAGGVIFAEFFSELTGGGVSAAEILTGGPLFPNADANQWTTFNGTATAGPDVSGGVTLQLKAGNGGDANSLAQIFFDNVSVSIPGTTVPEPGSLAVLGLGALGLIARRRRA